MTNPQALVVLETERDGVTTYRGTVVNYGPEFEEMREFLALLEAESGRGDSGAFLAEFVAELAQAPVYSTIGDLIEGDGPPGDGDGVSAASGLFRTRVKSHRAGTVEVLDPPRGERPGLAGFWVLSALAVAEVGEARQMAAGGGEPEEEFGGALSPDLRFLARHVPVA